MTNKQNSKITAALSIGVVFIILLTIIAIGVFTLPKKETPSPTQQPSPPTLTITITAAGFEPASAIVKKGSVITWVNNDDKPHQVAANPHPTSSSLPGLRSEILNNKQSYSFTATKAGSFGYHDQLNPGVNGSFVVKDSVEADKE